MNLHPTHQHYDTAAFRGKNAKGNVQSSLPYEVCFGPAGIVL
jgi:hypothetical protein